MNGKKIIFIDIDDTLVRTYGLKRIPIPKTIQAIFRFHKEGSEIYLWSNGGSDYCKKNSKRIRNRQMHYRIFTKANFIY